MKKGTRILTVLLSALLILSAFSGCGGNESSSSASQGGSSASTKEGSSAGSGEESAPAPAEAGAFQLPITEEKTTVTLFTSNDSNLTTMVDDFNETPFWQELERRTNVHIEFDMPATGNETTAYNLLFASGELPDMVKNTNPGYPGGLDAAIDDGYYLDLTDLVPEKCPNYWKRLNDFSNEFDDNVLRSAYTGSGRIGAVGQLMHVPQGPWAGLYVRGDWLKDLNLETPQTYEDWEAMLTAFKNEKGATAPLLLGTTGYDSLYSVLSVGCGVTSAWYQEDGVVKFGPAQEGWREYVTILHDWYEKGLIDPDFMSSTSPVMFVPDTAMVTTNKTGAFMGIYTNVGIWEGSATDPNATYVPVYPPMKKAGDTHDFQSVVLSGATATMGVSISAKSENVDTCLKLLDYLFTDEGALLCNYGIEGDTFEYDDEGEPKFTDKVVANEELSFSQAMAYYCMPGARCCWQDWRRELDAVPAKDVVSYDVWGPGTSDKSMPAPSSLSMDPELNTEFSKIMADVQTVVDEKTPQFISGVLSLEEFDAYLETIESMGVARATEIVQQAYDSFMAR